MHEKDPNSFSPSWSHPIYSKGNIYFIAHYIRNMNQTNLGLRGMFYNNRRHGPVARTQNMNEQVQSHHIPAYCSSLLPINPTSLSGLTPQVPASSRQALSCSPYFYRSICLYLIPVLFSHSVLHSPCMSSDFSVLIS